MILQSPLKQGIKVKKWFGSNTELNSLADLLLCVSQGFGERPEYYGGIGHNGADFVCEYATPILASHDGEAAYYEEKDADGNFIGYGRYVTIRDRENNFKTEYCHLSKVIKTGQVKTGEVIGLAGSSGNSTNPHLHFTLKNPYAIDPIPHLVWFNDMELIKLKDNKDIWLVRNGKRSLVYNVSAFQLIGGNIDQVKELTDADFNAISDSGIVLAGIPQE